jgi:ATP-binding cassette subfamily C protein
VASRVKTPGLLQMEAVECGAAALGIVLAHHGRVVGLTELREACGVSRDGSKASNIVKAAKRYDLLAKGFSKDVDELRTLAPPFVVFWRFNHFLVVEGFGRNCVYLNDPARGHRRVSVEEFADAYTGVVLMFEAGPDFQRGGRRPSTLRSLARRVAGFWPALGYAVAAGLLLVIPGLAVPALTQVFIDDVLVEGRDGWLAPLVLALIAAAAAQALLKLLQLGQLRRLGQHLATRHSSQFFRHLLMLPASFYAQRFAGEVSNRSRLNDKLARVLSGQLAQALIDCVAMAFYAALMFAYNWMLTLVGILCAAVNYAVLRSLAASRVEAHQRVSQELGKLAGFSIAGLQSIETLKASGIESGFFRRWSGYLANATNAQHELQLWSQPLAEVPQLLGALASITVLTVGGLLVMDSPLVSGFGVGADVNFTIGMLVAFHLLMAGFLRPLARMVELGRTLQELRGNVNRLDDVLAHAPDPGFTPALGVQLGQSSSGEREKLRLDGRVSLRGVSFGYSPLEPPLIAGFDLELPPGRRVALVGASGSGKSTIARLVCGTWQPWAGEVLFDGQPRGGISRSLLADSLGYVDQDLLLFGGTIRENLTLWDATVSDASLERAAEDADILDLVRSLPAGFDAELIEGGANLSGGQRQRLEIARALVNDPSILVLDEATSALDAETEERIIERLQLRGCSCLLVAHRLSTIRDCDEIIVLEHGQVVERGTHAELMARGDAYRRLIGADGGEASA